jgi:Mg-chelatase subunit ChlD
VVDCEATPRPLGVARALAEAMGARYVAMGSPVDGGAVSGGRLAEAIWDSIG